MRVKRAKAAAIGTVVAGTVLAGGCLGNLPWQQLFWSAAVNTGLEFVLDNDAVFDVFPDGNTAPGS